MTDHPCLRVECHSDSSNETKINVKQHKYPIFKFKLH
jgi:hypothetical protein